MNYDMVLIQKPLDEGMTTEEIICIAGCMKGSAYIPLEFQAEQATGMGFISIEKADEIDYLYSESSLLAEKVRDILDDVEKESADEAYEFNISGVTVSAKIMYNPEVNKNDQNQF